LPLSFEFFVIKNLKFGALKVFLFSKKKEFVKKSGLKSIVHIFSKRSLQVLTNPTGGEKYGKIFSYFSNIRGDTVYK